jgi:catechol 2,3-dioxygenase-like lactoylglutathione lyase family enzyme
MAPPIARSPGDCGVRPGFVTFPPSAVVSSNGSPTDTNALREVIVGTWERYLHIDGAGLRTYLADDCIRMSGGWGAGTVQRGADSIVAQLGSEAQASERPTGIIAQEHAISDAELWFDPSGTAATAVYHDAVRSGYRWCDSNEGVVLQAFTKQAGRWRVAHWTDSSHSALGTDELGDETFKFDFSYPATDLNRAVDFYTPILGPPESLVGERAVFLLPRGWRFVLDATELDGIAKVSSGLPNGWATIYVEDVEAQLERLRSQGAQFVGELRHDGPDLYAVGLDEPDLNPFVLLQRNYSTNGPLPSTPRGFTGGDAWVARAGEIARAWVSVDAAAIDSLYGKSGWLFDDTRIKTREFETGAEVSRALSDVYWPRYDRSPEGLSVDLIARDAVSRQYGERAIVSYLQDLSGTGEHPFHETALVTHMLGADGRPIVSFTTASDWNAGTKVLGPDYIGYPTSDLKETERFYQHTMGFGVPYDDQAYRGWWSDNGSVYGTYTAHPSRDRLPRPNLPSAYNSFWVRSAKDTYSYLKQRGVSFPRIPAINGHQGITRYHGYTEVVATDSEGNLVIFTEYTGE